MQLTKEEESILAGEKGDTLRRAMEILTALGKIYSAKRMVNITSAQVSGVSYKNLGEAGIEFLTDFLCKGKAKTLVPTTLNPCGMDLKDWKKMGISKDFAEKQLVLIDIFNKIGIAPTCSCVPYLIGNRPRFKDHISWAESSAVSFANSVIGARTNRESGISAICSSILGFTPEYGYHLDENRRGTHKIEVKAELKTESDFAALGYLIGKEVNKGVPYFTGFPTKNSSENNLRFLGAAMAASGAVALYHVKGITPAEEKNEPMLNEDCEKITIESLKEGYESLNFSGNDELDLVTIGCPHASINEFRKIKALLSGKKISAKLWIMTSRKIREIANNEGLIKDIEKSGAKIFSDTCMIVSPMEKLGFKNIAVNSGKAAFYLPSYCNAKVKFGSLENCINAAVNGRW